MLIATEKDYGDYTKGEFVIRSDGSYSSILQSQIDSNWVKMFALKFIEIQKSTLIIASDTSNIYFDYFKKLLIALKKDGVIPIVYISPINPLVFDNICPDMHVALEDNIDSFCKENLILRVGSFNPHKYGYHTAAKLWRDAYHPVSSVVSNIFNSHREQLKTIGINVEQSSMPKTPVEKAF
jgi:hypothetical protein